MHNELTRQDLKMMREELDYRRITLRPKLLEAVKEARAFGDLSENFEYKAAKQEKNRNESRIRFLENMIKTAKVFDDTSGADQVGLYDKVTVYMEDDDETEVYQIVTTMRQDVLKGLISKDLAEKNGLKIGDKIQTDKGVEIEIVGLFSPKEIEGINDQVTTYDKIQNLIITDLATLVAYENGPAIQGFNELTVSVDDPQNMEEIISKVKGISGVDWKGFSFLLDNEDYENAASSLEQLSELVATILIVALIVSIAILSLILTMWARTRIHETGVLLSVGISKLSILGQYIAEVLLIAVLAFSLSYFSASAIAGQMGNVLQSGQAVTEVQQENGLSAGSRGEAGTDAEDQKIEPPKLQVRVQFEEMGLLFLLGIGIVTVSAGFSSISVMRLKPREILSKMS